MLEQAELLRVPIKDVKGECYDFICIFEKYDYGNIYPPAYKLRIKLHNERKYYAVVCDYMAEGDEIPSISKLANLLSKHTHDSEIGHAPLTHSLHFAVYTASVTGAKGIKLPTNITGKTIYVEWNYIDLIVDTLKEKVVELMLLKPKYNRVV